MIINRPHYLAEIFKAGSRYSLEFPGTYAVIMLLPPHLLNTLKLPLVVISIQCVLLADLKNTLSSVAQQITSVSWIQTSWTQKGFAWNYSTDEYGIVSDNRGYWTNASKKILDNLAPVIFAGYIAKEIYEWVRMSEPVHCLPLSWGQGFTGSYIQRWSKRGRWISQNTCKDN